ncbi:MAG: hypothetical protein AAFY71_08940 [Bacteroidota bacterium]
MKKLNNIGWGVIWLPFLFLQATYAQIPAGPVDFETAQAIFGTQHLLTFQKFSLELKDESKAELDKVVNVVLRQPQIIQRTFIVLQVFTCEQELNVKSYLGVVRAKQITDYLTQKLGMPRKKILIQDRGANPLDKDCLAGSGMTLFLKPDWREGKD